MNHRTAPYILVASVAIVGMVCTSAVECFRAKHADKAARIESLEKQVAELQSEVNTKTAEITQLQNVVSGEIFPEPNDPESCK